MAIFLGDKTGTPTNDLSRSELRSPDALGDPPAYADASGPDQMYGYGGNDILQGYGGSDELFGGDGDDILYGNSNQFFPDPNDVGDKLYGEAGNDQLYGDLGDDTLDGGYDFDTLDGGSGTDTADYTFFNGRTIIDLAAGRADFPDNNPLSQVEQLISIENVITGGGQDEIKGGGNNNMLSSGAGNDTLDGGAGDDTLNGGLDSDTVVLAGMRSDYTFAGVPTDFSAARSGETDTILDVEFLTFGNGETVAVEDLLVPPDTTQPSVTVDIEDTVLNDSDNTSRVIFTFSEAIAAGSFTPDDVSVANGALSSFVVAADGLSATATFTATDSINDTGSVSVASGRFTDAAGNQNTASNIDTVAINTRTDSVIEGGPGPDSLRGTPNNDIMDGQGGNDTLFGSAAGDQMIGGPGRDTVRYTRTVTLDLENGDLNTGQAAGDAFSSIESFDFSNGTDKAYGDASANRFFGGNGRDLLDGRAGNDVLHGENGSDQLFGGDGDDRLFGENGNDRLFGEDGNDRLSGGNGSDLLAGGLGRDVMNGNGGRDRYDFNSVEESSVGSQRDVVFLSGRDRIDLRTIDADEDTSGNQAFRWVDRSDLDAAFTGRDGQVRFSNGVLRGDTDGDRVADFEIRIFGSFSAGDVIL
jgi:Ca2+-binding RTX toxin-like protein